MSFRRFRKRRWGDADMHSAGRLLSCFAGRHSGQKRDLTFQRRRFVCTKERRIKKSGFKKKKTKQRKKIRGKSSWESLSTAVRWPQSQREAAPYRPGSGSLCVKGLSGLLGGWLSVWETQQGSLLLWAGGKLQWCLSSITHPYIRAEVWLPAAPTTDPALRLNPEHSHSSTLCYCHLDVFSH